MAAVRAADAQLSDANFDRRSRAGLDDPIASEKRTEALLDLLGIPII